MTVADIVILAVEQSNHDSRCKNVILDHRFVLSDHEQGYEYRNMVDSIRITSS